MNSTQLGAYHELKASSYFLSLGYEVFRNVVSTGPADLVIWKPDTNETLFVDVKTATRFVKSDGTIKYHFDRKSLRYGVKVLLMYEGEVLGFSEEYDAE